MNTLIDLNRTDIAIGLREIIQMRTRKKKRLNAPTSITYRICNALSNNTFI